MAGRLKASAAHMLRNRGEHCLPVPYRMQVDGHCCGLCSALMVAEYYGFQVEHEQVERFERNNGDGTDTGPMTRFLRASGLSVRVYKEKQARIATLIDALENGIPVIVSVRPPHYLVVVGYDARFFYVNDPFLLLRVSGRLTRQEFRWMWTGEALLVTERPLTSHRFPH